MLQQLASADMHWTGKVERIAFSIGSVDVAWYGIIVTSAMLLGLFLAYLRGRKHGFKGDDYLEIFLFVIPLAVLFARAGYSMVRPEMFMVEGWSGWERFVKFFAVWDGGLTITTGVIGGILGAFLWTLWRKVDFLVLVDSALPVVLASQALGRWGNFFNQELYGGMVTNPKLQFFPYAVFIDSQDAFFQATFFYEMALNLMMLAIILILLKRLRLKGGGTLMYLIAYGSVRFVMEFIRDDGSIYDVVNFTQISVGVVALVSLIVLIVLIVLKVKKGERIWYKNGIPKELVFAGRKPPKVSKELLEKAKEDELRKQNKKPVSNKSKKKKHK